ncbi:MAG: PAS domain S-box protein [Desulfohalobiaceae bacterium]|nr:PAS domain S-box protein [Desulfohalobiaceae bacterium]
MNIASCVYDQWTNIEKRFLPPHAWQSDPLTFWRERILFLICFISAVFGLIALIPSLMLSYHERLWSVVIIDLAAYCTIVAILIFRRVDLKIRAYTACLILYMLGIGLLFVLGPIGAGYIWLFGASVLMGAIIGLRAAFLSLLLNAVTLLVIEAFIVYEKLAWAFLWDNASAAWLVMTANFLVLNALVTLTIAFMLNGLKQSLIKEQEISANLRESEERFRSLFEDIAGIAVQGFGLDRRIVYWNQASAELYGFSQEEAIGRKWEDVVIPEDLRGFMAGRVEQWIHNGKSMPPGESTRMNKSEDPIPVFSSYLLHRSVTGDLLMFSVDLSLKELQHAEAERVKLLQAIEQSDEMIVVTDAKGCFEYVNPAFSRVTGYSPEEVHGRDARLLMPSDHEESVLDKIRLEITRGRPWRGQLMCAAKDGSLFVQDTSVAPVVDQTGTISSFIGVNRDITEQLRIQEEKEKLEEQYRQSQKVEAIGRLAGGVAHDLNNLLTPIVGFGEMLQEEFRHDTGHLEPINEIVKAGFRATDLVRQLLAFSRKQTLEYKQVDLNQALGNFEKLLRRTIREDIEISFVTESGLGPVMADIGQIEQVIMNLAVNAQDAMPEGGKLVFETAAAALDETYAKTHAGLQTGEYVQLVVTDTGCGMDGETLNNLFEPFFTTKGEQGTGLGLATVYGIVKQHGGHIYVYSEQKQGTSFKIYLPVSEEPAFAGQKENEPNDWLQGTETVLLAEDNGQVRELAATILEKFGYRVFPAENGSEALKVLENHLDQVHFLLTDVIMPDMNGRELFVKARALQQDLKVLYMSGYTDQAIDRHGVLDEGVDFIQKPFTVRGLVSKVRETLDSEKTKHKGNK